MSHRLTTEEFIKRFNEITNNKYDTSKVDYIDSRDNKVCIICHNKDALGEEHGEFFARPTNLLHGYGCPKCGKVYRYNTEEFVELAKHIHGEKYDYSKVDYKTTKDKIEIVCHEKDENGNEHGSFFQTPNKHLQGRGCPLCAKLLRGRERKTFESFVSEAREVHGDKYDYLEFEKFSSKAKIYCHEKDENGEEHGVFWQLPGNHLKGRGCPKCNNSHLEEKVSVILKKHNIQFETQKRFDWLKKWNFLPLDFYIPVYNIAIECQGKQHFECVNFGGKMTIEEQKKNLETQKKNDLFKKQECEKNGVKLIYVNYFDKSIENQIIKELK